MTGKVNICHGINLPSYLQTTIIAQMFSIGGKEGKVKVKVNMDLYSALL